jgi:hypothetical protein
MSKYDSHFSKGNDNSHSDLLPIPESVMARVSQKVFGGDDLSDLSDQEREKPQKTRSRK